MTRQECEKKVLDLLRQIKDVVVEYNPETGVGENGSCCMAVGAELAWAFILDKNDKPIIDVKEWYKDLQEWSH